MKIAVRHFLNEIRGLTEFIIMNEDAISKEIISGTLICIPAKIASFGRMTVLLDSLYMNQKLVMSETFFKNELKNSISFHVCSIDIWEETLSGWGVDDAPPLYIKFDSKLEAMKFKLVN